MVQPCSLTCLATPHGWVSMVGCGMVCRVVMGFEVGIADGIGEGVGVGLGRVKVWIWLTFGVKLPTGLFCGFGEKNKNRESKKWEKIV